MEDAGTGPPERPVAETGGLAWLLLGAAADAAALHRQLHAALVTRDLVGWATGIVMAGQGGTADDAFDVLRFVARRSGRTLRDVASDLIIETRIAQGDTG